MNQVSNPDNKDRTFTKDRDVLDQSIQLVNELLESEETRRKNAESRAGQLMTVTSITAAALLFIIETVVGIKSGDFLVLIYFSSATTIVLMVKSLIYFVGTLKVYRSHQLNEQIVFDIQKKDIVNSLQYEIDSKIWVLKRIRQPNTGLLFSLYRAQLNLIWCIISLLLLVLLMFIDSRMRCSSLHNLDYILGIVLLCISIVFDPIRDRLGGFWSFKRDTKNSKGQS